MAKKKAPNWEEIKTRYVVGWEKPADIAKDYNVIAQTISNRASKEKWNEERLETGKEIREIQKEKLKELTELNLDVHIQFLKKLKSSSMMDMISNPFLFDGERTNSLFQTAMNNATRIALGQMKAQEEEATEEEPPGFNVS